MNNFVKMKKKFYFLGIVFLFALFSKTIFSEEITGSGSNIPKGKSKIKKDLPELKSIFEQAGMKGSFLVFSQNRRVFQSYNNKRAKTGYLPASTFKIPNSIIGLETGIINSETIFKWDGEKRRMEAWEKDLPLKDAFQVSCVPCYQEVARKIGLSRMTEYLKKYKYGKMEINENNIDKFWLEGESKITSYEQIEFLRKFYEGELPIKQTTKAIMLGIMLQDKGDNYKIYGKTGWSVRDGNNYGWYVGFLTTLGNVYYFALNLEPKNQKDFSNFANSRKEITFECFKKLGIIK